MDRLAFSPGNPAGPPGGQTMSSPVPPPLPANAPVQRLSRRACAGFWRRLMALLADGILLALTLWLGHLLIRWIHHSALAGAILDARGITASRMGAMAALARIAFDVAFPVAYFAIFEASSRAATPGKRLLGFRVRARSGQKAGFGRVVLRNLLKWLSAAPLMAGFLLAMVTPRRQALHDLLTGSVMIKDRALTASGPPPVPRGA